MRSFYVEVIGSRDDVDDVLMVCKEHYAKCVYRPVSRCEHIIQVNVDNILQKWRIQKNLKLFNRMFMDQADVRVF